MADVRAEVQKVLSDPNFHAFPIEQQREIMGVVDPNFLKLARPDQDEVLTALTTPKAAPYDPARRGDKLKGTTTGLGDSYMGTLASDLAAVPETAAYALRHPIDYIDQSLKGLFSIPDAAGEMYEKGQWGKMAARATEAVLPFVGHAELPLARAGAAVEGAKQAFGQTLKAAPKLSPLENAAAHAAGHVAGVPGPVTSLLTKIGSIPEAIRSMKGGAKRGVYWHDMKLADAVPPVPKPPEPYTGPFHPGTYPGPVIPKPKAPFLRPEPWDNPPSRFPPFRPPPEYQGPIYPPGTTYDLQGNLISGPMPSGRNAVPVPPEPVAPKPPRPKVADRLEKTPNPVVKMAPPPTGLEPGVMPSGRRVGTGIPVPPEPVVPKPPRAKITDILQKTPTPVAEMAPLPTTLEPGVMPSGRRVGTGMVEPPEVAPRVPKPDLGLEKTPTPVAEMAPLPDNVQFPSGRSPLNAKQPLSLTEIKAKFSAGEELTPQETSLLASEAARIQAEKAAAAAPAKGPATVPTPPADLPVAPAEGTVVEPIPVKATEAAAPAEAPTKLPAAPARTEIEILNKHANEHYGRDWNDLSPQAQINLRNFMHTHSRPPVLEDVQSGLFNKYAHDPLIEGAPEGLPLTPPTTEGVGEMLAPPVTAPVEAPVTPPAAAPVEAPVVPPAEAPTTVPINEPPPPAQGTVNLGQTSPTYLFESPERPSRTSMSPGLRAHLAHTAEGGEWNQLNRNFHKAGEEIMRGQETSGARGRPSGNATVEDLWPGQELEWSKNGENRISLERMHAINDFMGSKGRTPNAADLASGEFVDPDAGLPPKPKTTPPPAAAKPPTPPPPAENLKNPPSETGATAKALEDAKLAKAEQDALAYAQSGKGQEIHSISTGSKDPKLQKLVQKLIKKNPKATPEQIGDMLHAQWGPPYSKAAYTAFAKGYMEDRLPSTATVKPAAPPKPVKPPPPATNLKNPPTVTTEPVKPTAPVKTEPKVEPKVEPKKEPAAKTETKTESHVGEPEFPADVAAKLHFNKETFVELDDTQQNILRKYYRKHGRYPTEEDVDTGLFEGSRMPTKEQRAAIHTQMSNLSTAKLESTYAAEKEGMNQAERDIWTKEIAFRNSPEMKRQ